MDDKPKSKSLVLVSEGTCHRIKWEGGGEMPKELSGLYTSAREAQAAIDRWQANKMPSRKHKGDTKVKTNGEISD